MSVSVTFNLNDISGIIKPRQSEALARFAETMVESAKEGTPYDTGNNRSEITVVTAEPDHYAIGTMSGYGAYLEFGTARMPARPYFLPAAEVARQMLENMGPGDWQ